MNSPFHYEAIKNTPLTQDERRRLRTIVSVQMRLKGMIGSGSGDNVLTRKILHFLEAPETKGSAELLNWLLAFAPPALLQEMWRRTPGVQSTVLGDLEVVRQAGVTRLLPRDYISPELQRWQTSTSPHNTLVCFTAKAGKVNIPVQLFHSLVADKFDLIYYLRDPEKRFFTDGIPGIATNTGELCDYLRAHIPESSRISVLGVSSGGYVATDFARQVAVDRLTLFSPPLTYNDATVISNKMATPASRARIYFAKCHKRDREWAREWKRTKYKSAIKWIKTDSHGTLDHLYRHGDFEEFLAWMSGKQKKGLFNFFNTHPK